MLKRTPSWMTLGDLQMLAGHYEDHVFKVDGLDCSPEEIISWRGAYNQPAILLSSEGITGAELCKNIEQGLSCEHEGYKGGHYWYSSSDIFRIVDCHSSSDDLSAYGYKIDTGKKIIELIVANNEY